VQGLGAAPQGAWGRSRRRAARLAAALALAAAAAGCAGGSPTASTASTPPSPPGTPPEVVHAAGAFPAPNVDYANTRSVVGSRITAANVGRLRRVWSLPLSGAGTYGSFSANPVVVGRTVYLQDLDSDVLAVDRRTGRVRWRRRFGSPTIGPNGVVAAGGLVLGATAANAFAIDAATGRVRWQLRLVRQPSEGIDMAPIVWNGEMLVSTVPGAGFSNFYGAGGRGVLWALDAATGTPRWSLDTAPGLWGNPRLNSGGGSWHPPAVDGAGRLYWGVGNPAPWPGLARYPNGASRPGPNPYTDSLVVVDGRTGRVLWHWQAIAHDLRNWDLHLPPMLTTFQIDGRPRDVVVLGGKMGTVYVLDRETHRLLWKRDVGIHLNDGGAGRNAPFRRLPQRVYPGWLGGIQTPMAVAGGVIYVPVNNLCAVFLRQDNATRGSRLCDPASGSGEIVALDGATGRQLWRRAYRSQNYGAATVVNDLVFTAWFDGTIRAFAARDGRLVWSARAPAAVNAPPAIAGGMLIVGAGYAARPGQRPAVVAWRLPPGVS
jgi:outer membrane protein assembly factor BamB